MKQREKIAVAYSGGLDTSVMVPWLKERYDADIITVTGNLGQRSELNGIQQKANQTGASRAYVLDLRKEFVSNYIFRALKAGALYEQSYPMAASLGRPLLASALVKVAKREKCTAVAHGCTGKGNDQVRFEASIAALAPELKVLAPVREWEFKSREQELDYAAQHHIPVTATKKSPYSIDENIWGTSIECGVLEDPMAEPPPDAYQWTTSPEEAPDDPVYVIVEFQRGIPIALNDRKMDGPSLLEKLNHIAAAHGVGRLDIVENRLVGIKSREIYEAPAATVLLFAHCELERLTLDKDVFQYKNRVAQDYANLIYNGLWFSPLRESLDALIEKTQERVTGTVRIKLYKGNVMISGRCSPYSLYDHSLATYSEQDQFDHSASEGFIKIFSLPLRTYFQVGRNSSGKRTKNNRAR
ncbi:MAG: argininosuccinate synthase [Bacteroidota bacterium]